jgi:hypothetical protein
VSLIDIEGTGGKLRGRGADEAKSACTGGSAAQPVLMKVNRFRDTELSIEHNLWCLR